MDLTKQNISGRFKTGIVTTAFGNIDGEIRIDQYNGYSVWFVVYIAGDKISQARETVSLSEALRWLSGAAGE